MRVILLPLAGEWYAVDLNDVREVVDEVTVEPLVTAAQTVAGVFNLRGEVIPLLDTGRLLGLAAIGEGSFVLVVDVEGHAAGLALDGRPTTGELGALLGQAELDASRGVYAVIDGPRSAEAAVLLDVPDLVAAGAQS